jgi:hypothetical protein
VVAGVVSLVHIVLRMIEMRYVDHEYEPLRVTVRGAALTYICVLVGWFLVDLAHPLIRDAQSGGGRTGGAEIFLGEPNF